MVVCVPTLAESQGGKHVNIRRLYEDLVENLVNAIADKASALADRVVKFQMGHRWLVHEDRRSDETRLTCTCGGASVVHVGKRFILVKGTIEQGSLQLVEIEAAKTIDDVLDTLYRLDTRYRHHH